MPIYDYLCRKCGSTSEILITGPSESPTCDACGSNDLKKLLSAHSSMSGSTKKLMPGLGDTTCCGNAPGTVEGCAGPGSCCGNLKPFAA